MRQRTKIITRVLGIAIWRNAKPIALLSVASYFIILLSIQLVLGCFNNQLEWYIWP